MNKIPEKPRLLGILKDAGFDVPDFLFMSGEDFDQGNFNKLKDFLDHSCSSFKVIVRSAHPLEDRFKGGTFDSLETNCDVNGILYARNLITRDGKFLPKRVLKLPVWRLQMQIRD